MARTGPAHTILLSVFLLCAPCFSREGHFNDEAEWVEYQTVVVDFRRELESVSLLGSVPDELPVVEFGSSELVDGRFVFGDLPPDDSIALRFMMSQGTTISGSGRIADYVIDGTELRVTTRITSPVPDGEAMPRPIPVFFRIDFADEAGGDETTGWPSTARDVAERYARRRWVVYSEDVLGRESEGKMAQISEVANASTGEFFPDYASFRLLYGDGGNSLSMALLVCRPDSVVPLAPGPNDGQWHPLAELRGSGAPVETEMRARRAMVAYAKLLQLGLQLEGLPVTRTVTGWRCSDEATFVLELVLGERNRLEKAKGRYLFPDYSIH